MKSFLLYDLSSYALSTVATPGEFENGGFSLKAHQMFSVHTTPEKFHGVVFDENSVRGITWFSCLHRFRKLKSSFKRLSVCTKTKSQRFQIPRVWRALSKSFVFQWRISEDERSNRRKKAAVLVDDNAGSGWSDSKRNFKTSIQISVMITLYACSNSAKLYKKRVQTTWWTSGFSFVYWQ